MRVLAFDTSSKVGAIVALEWPTGDPCALTDIKLVSEWSLSVDTSFHSERLLWGVHETLEAARWKLEEVDLFGVGVGPGSFTGLRIGMTTARTLATVGRKPLAGVSSLAALARPAALWCSAMDTKVLVVAATDACKGELFALHGFAGQVRGCVAKMEGEPAELWKRGADEEVIHPEKLMLTLKAKLKDHRVKWVAVGEGRARYPEQWKKLPASREIKSPVPFSSSVQGRYLGMLIWEAARAGLARDPLLVHPRYLRASDAELKLKAGLLVRGPTGSPTGR